MNSPRSRVSCSLGLFFGAILLSPFAQAEGWSSFSINDPHWFINFWHNKPYTYQFDQLPLSGSTANDQIPWSDSFWPSQRGGMAYRWYENQDENQNQELPPEELRKRFFEVHRYSLNELRSMTREQIRKKLSPIEKYSVFIGDYSYKLLSKFIVPENSQDEYWEGFCHAWAPAANHFTEPKPVTRKNRDGIIIDFGTADVKALLIANYSQTTEEPFKKLFGKRTQEERKAFRVARREARRAARRRGETFRNEDFVMKTPEAKEPMDTPETPRFAFVGARCEERFLFKALKVKNNKESLGNYIDSNGMLETEYPEYLRKYQSYALRVLNTPKLIQDEFKDDSPLFIRVDEDGKRIEDDEDDGSEIEGTRLVQNPNFVAEAIQNSKASSCSDTNAGAFHIVVTNQLGILREGFQFDKTPDKEIWNQPAYRYDSSVVRFETPTTDSAPGTARVVVVKTRLYFGEDTDHGWAYWNSTLMSLFKPEKSFMDEFNRYSKMLMNEGEATAPAKYPDGIMDFADYQYKLELNAYGEIIGGTWLTIDRPDFLWIMRKLPFMKDYKRLVEIYEPLKFPADSVKPNLGD